MSLPSPNSAKPFVLPPRVLLAFLTLVLALSTPGCQSNSHTSDARLRKIDQTLAAQLPKGTPRSRVEFFLHSRGFPQQYSADPKDVVAIVRLVDTDTLQPATARVTFHFDPLEKLTTYDMEAAPNDVPQ
jgi:hypothetical protein